MLEVHNVSKSFGMRYALRDVNFRISPGETVFLVGPNGAGKTTLLRIIASLTRPSAGSVYIAGQNLIESGVAIRGQIGYLSHRTLLYDDLSAEQNLQFYARMYSIPQPKQRITFLLEQVNLTNRRFDLVRTYSRGMQQRLAVARAVLHQPRLLLLDEPYSGLDVLAVDTLTQLLHNLTVEGCSILITTHNLENLDLAERRAVILNQGRLIHDDVFKDGESFSRTYKELLTAGSINTVQIPEVSPTPKNNPSLADLLPAQEHPNFFKQTIALIRKDIAAELHTREIFNAMFIFAVLAMLIFSFALDLRGAVARAAAPGVLWATIVFAGTLGLSRSMTREQQTGGIEGLLLIPAERAVIWSGKAAGNWLMMMAVEVVLVPLATVMLNVSFFHPGVIFALFIGTTGYAAVGTLLSAIAINTRAREVMLPILLLPLLVPLLIGAVQVTGGLIGGDPWTAVSGWIRGMILYDLIFIAVALVVFGYIVEE
jgi:heme ABC exporter ATP-binding subunit CcmA/heme exporter protein CcmB